MWCSMRFLIILTLARFAFAQKRSCYKFPEDNSEARKYLEVSKVFENSQGYQDIEFEFKTTATEALLFISQSKAYTADGILNQSFRSKESVYLSNGKIYYNLFRPNSSKRGFQLAVEPQSGVSFSDNMWRKVRFYRNREMDAVPGRRWRWLEPRAKSLVIGLEVTGGKNVTKEAVIKVTEPGTVFFGGVKLADNVSAGMTGLSGALRNIRDMGANRPTRIEDATLTDVYDTYCL